jgi:uncharacterized protein YbjT (DUF2867 family)
MTTIALTAPTGKVGSAVLEIAKERGLAVRALARNSKRFAIAPAESVRFDFSDPTTFAPALRGIRTLILVAPSSPRQADEEIAVCDAALDEGVAHIVKLSVQGAEPGGITFANLHQKVERHLTARHAPATFLRPTFFMQNALGLAAAIANGTFPSAMGDAAIGQVDTLDIADVALTVASDPGPHAGKAYDLTGPAAYRGTEIAAILSEAIGQPVRYVDVPEDAFRASLLENGLDPWYAEGLVELYRIVRAGYTSAISTHVADVTGHPPRSFADFARDNAAAFV